MVERANNPERNKPLEPTPAQIAASQIAFFLEASEIIKRAAKEQGGTIKQRKATRDALTDLYFIQANNLSAEPFREKWDGKADTFAQLLEKIHPELDKTKEAYAKSASELNGRQRTRIALKATKKLTALSKGQRQHLFEMGGYLDVSKKLGISGGLTFVTGSIANTLVGGAIFYETTSPTINLASITDIKTAAAVALSYGTHYASIGLASKTNYKLLENQTIKTCPNLWATSLYFLTEKFFPDKKKRSRRGVTLGTFAPALLQEPAYITTLAITAIGPHIVFARNVAGAAFNILEAAANTVWLEVAKRKDKQ